MKWFPGRRPQRATPTGVGSILMRIPKAFTDDGCSNSPDEWFGFDFKWACRIHDARYCQRTPIDGASVAPQGTPEHRHYADDWLRADIKSSLPWRWRWIGWVYWAGVRAAGGFKAYNSCYPLFPAGGTNHRCRHGMTRIDT